MKKAKTKALLMAALMVCGLPLQVNAGQLEVETSDVITVVNNCVPYLIGFAVVAVIAIVISIVNLLVDILYAFLDPRIKSSLKNY